MSVIYNIIRFRLENKKNIEKVDAPRMPLSCKYPMYAMRVVDFLALERMLPHQELQARGLVVPLDMDAEHEPACVHFISHQWLGFRTADPHGVHLRCMQDVFRRTIAGESLFSSEED